MPARTTLVTICLLLVSTTLGGVATATPAPATSGGSPAAIQSECSYPVTKTDTTGTDVTVDQQPERIVVLQPSDAQIAWEIGAQDRVVGMARTQYTSYLSGRNDTTNIKTQDGSVAIEQVVGLQPDIVLASNTTSIETVRKLRQTGVTVYHFGLVVSLDEIARNIETVGALVGRCEAATQRANEFRLDVATVERAAALAEARPSVLYYFFGYTSGNETHIHDVIETAGGDNIAAQAGISGYAQLSSEVAVDRDPDWILYPSHASLPSSAAYNETTALRTNQTIELNADYISQPGPRVVIPLMHLANRWHPDALAQANETVTMDNVTTPETTTQTSETGPGFGLVAALAGLLATACFLRRQ